MRIAIVPTVQSARAQRRPSARPRLRGRRVLLPRRMKVEGGGRVSRSRVSRGRMVAARGASGGGGWSAGKSRVAAIAPSGQPPGGCRRDRRALGCGTGAGD
jgi:hypothetical protein